MQQHYANYIGNSVQKNLEQRFSENLLLREESEEAKFSPIKKFDGEID